MVDTIDEPHGKPKGLAIVGTVLVCLGIGWIMHWGKQAIVDQPKSAIQISHIEIKDSDWIEYGGETSLMNTPVFWEPTDNMRVVREGHEFRWLVNPKGELLYKQIK